MNPGEFHKIRENPGESGRIREFFPILLDFASFFEFFQIIPASVGFSRILFNFPSLHAASSYSFIFSRIFPNFLRFSWLLSSCWNVLGFYVQDSLEYSRIFRNSLQFSWISLDPLGFLRNFFDSRGFFIFVFLVLSRIWIFRNLSDFCGFCWIVSNSLKFSWIFSYSPVFFRIFLNSLRFSQILSNSLGFFLFSRTVLDSFGF